MSGTRRLGIKIHQGSGPSFGRKRQRSPVARSTKAKSAMLRPDEFGFGADLAQKGLRRVIARQEQMIAIVDHHAERRVEIGAATPAGLRRGLMDDNLIGMRREPQRRGEAGEAGADDMHLAVIVCAPRSRRRSGRRDKRWGAPIGAIVRSPCAP